MILDGWRMLWTVAAIAIWLDPLGASANAENPRIEAFPPSVQLDGARARQQLVVTRHLGDGTERDVTPEAQFEAPGDALAAVSKTGVITPIRDGRFKLPVRFNDQSYVVNVEVTNAAATPSPSYRRDVSPVLSKAGCNAGACHGNLNGKGGFRLSLRGENPAFDHLMMTRDTLGRRVDRPRPDQSLILLKPTGRVSHEGGLRFRVDSDEARSIREWVSAGAGDDVATAPGLVRLTVFPAERVNSAPCLSQQLAVTAEFSDGSSRDVTRQAAFESSDPSLCAVSADGRVEVSAPGEVSIAVRYMTGRAVSRLAFVADRPDFSWPSDATPINVVDEHVFRKLKTLKIRPSALASDAVFLRRAWLDALGVLPPSEEVREFLRDADPAKRERLIDRLVKRPEFADFWALKWADLLRNEEKSMGPKGLWVFQRWLRDEIAADAPMDQFARRLVTGLGSTWQNPAANFYRTNRDPQTAAETIGQVFLGVRLQCARCHNHPFDVWTQDDYYGLAAYFANLKSREVNNVRKDDLDKHEINGDVIVYLSGKPAMVQPRSGEMMEPKPPGGPRPELCDDPNALDDLATWLTRENPQFARNAANRVWFHLMGRGIVEPVDDFRDSNPPSNPALLDAIVSEFTKNGMRLRPLVSLIMKSRTYGLGSNPDPTNAGDETNFSKSSVRLLPAEVLLDALGQALGSPERMSGPVATPRTLRAAQLPGVNMGGPFLKVFGKPERLLTCECERSDATTLAQAFQLINGESLRRMLEREDNRIGKLLKSAASDEAICEELYLSALCRTPTESEKQAASTHLARSRDRRKAWEDVAWALVNSKEFLLRH